MVRCVLDVVVWATPKVPEINCKALPPNAFANHVTDQAFRLAFLQTRRPLKQSHTVASQLADNWQTPPCPGLARPTTTTYAKMDLPWQMQETNDAFIMWNKQCISLCNICEHNWSAGCLSKPGLGLDLVPTWSGLGPNAFYAVAGPNLVRAGSTLSLDQV